MQRMRHLVPGKNNNKQQTTETRLLQDSSGSCRGETEGYSAETDMSTELCKRPLKACAGSALVHLRTFSCALSGPHAQVCVFAQMRFREVWAFGQAMITSCECSRHACIGNYCEAAPASTPLFPPPFRATAPDQRNQRHQLERKPKQPRSFFCTSGDAMCAVCRSSLQMVETPHTRKQETRKTPNQPTPPNTPNKNKKTKPKKARENSGVSSLCIIGETR